MANIPAYQTQNVEEILANAGGGGMPLITEGVYPAVIVESEFKDSKNGGNYLALKFVLTRGKHEGTEFTERLNLVNSNQTAVKIAYETLARIAGAVGMSTVPTDSKTLHNKPLLVKVVTEKGKPYMDNNGVQRDGKDKSILDQRGFEKLAAGENSTAPASSSKESELVEEKMPWEK